MGCNLIPIIKDSMRKEKNNFSVSEKKFSEFWHNDKTDSITVRFKINKSQDEIFYDVYSPKLIGRLKEETIQDVKRLDFINEENRRWNMAVTIENIWLNLDEIEI